MCLNCRSPSPRIQRTSTRNAESFERSVPISHGCLPKGGSIREHQSNHRPVSSQPSCCGSVKRLESGRAMSHRRTASHADRPATRWSRSQTGSSHRLVLLIPARPGTFAAVLDLAAICLVIRSAAFAKAMEPILKPQPKGSGESEAGCRVRGSPA
jgi:hypothetical protein